MELIRTAQPDQFLAEITPALNAEEARNSLILGIVGRLVRDPAYAQDPYFVRVMDGDQLVLAGMRTPPHGLVLTNKGPVRDEALSVLIDDVLAQPDPPPDVNAPRVLSRRFSQGWAAKSGGQTGLKMEQGLYALTEVAPETLHAASGALRPAQPDDLERFIRWREGFDMDAFGSIHGNRDQLRAFFEKHMDNIVYWEHDGEPVATALSTRPTEHGITVGMVYTPSAQRKKGYATALVAHLSQQLLNSGYDFCTLYTDLANPTSNHIYQVIGYRPIEEMEVHTLDPLGED